jgi:hypothetical protein
MVDSNLPFIHQLRLLVQPNELGGCPFQGAPLNQCGLSANLRATIPALTQLTKETIPMLRDQVRPASSCAANVIYPWSQLTLNDPNFNAANGFPPHKVYVEAADFLPGLAGESRDFDANGLYIRVLGALGNTGVTTLQSGLVGGTLAPLVGEQPQLPPNGQRPPLAGGDIPNYACETQPPIRDLSTPSTKAPQQYPATGLLPPALTQILQSLPPLPGIPLPLSKDVKGKNGKAAPLTAAQRAADLKQLRKTGLWEILSGANTSTTTSTTSQSNRARGRKAR